MSLGRELRFKSYNTRRNLPAASGRKRGEANFLGAFMRALMEEVCPPHVYGRHFAVPGCGVADFLLCQLPTRRAAVPLPDNLSLMAFETKLSDWKRALYQAYRYRYYADLSIVVLPYQKVTRPLQFRGLFSTLGIGLWTFDASASVIHRHLSPCENEPLNPTKRQQALARVQSLVVNLRETLIEAETLRDRR